MHRKTIPTWIFVGGAALSMIAGCVNTVGFLSIHRQALCHMSGLVTALGLDIGTGRTELAYQAFGILAAFFLGSLTSGFILRQSSLQIGRRYGVVLAIESILLFLATHFLRDGLRSGEFLAAMACGLQNAMASSYSGAVVRTTHTTGIVTDLGIACGHALRGQQVEWQRFQLYGVLLVGFFAGSWMGAVGFARLGYDTLLFPATFAGCTGLSYAIYKHVERRQLHRIRMAALAVLPGRPIPVVARDAGS
jgi:uncharacterized membrane protein YoaK (UPF0700 family)